MESVVRDPNVEDGEVVETSDSGKTVDPDEASNGESKASQSEKKSKTSEEEDRKRERRRSRSREKENRYHRKRKSDKDEKRYDDDYKRRRDRRDDTDEHRRLGRYWSGDHEPEYRDNGENAKYERYWKDRRDKDDQYQSRDDRVDQYLVGSRYYRSDEGRRRADGSGRRQEKGSNAEKEKESQENTAKKPMDLLTRTGGAYIPPGKLRLMQASITDKSSLEYQRIAWEALKKSIHGHINKVNTSNIGIVARLLFKENIVRGRGLLCRSILQAQAASPTFTNVYASLVSIINSKFPKIGELLLKRVIIQFKRAYKRNDKPVCISSVTFIAHLVNQKVAHEIIALEILTLLVENPTDDSVEVAIAFLKECGEKLTEVSSRGCNAIFDMLRNILHEGKLDKRVQYMIEVMFQVRKDNFRSFPSVLEELDLVNEEDQFTHLITLEDATDPQDLLNVFKMDGEYEQNEDKYKELRKEILDDDTDDSGSEEGSGSEDESGESGSENEDAEQTTIIDNTETNLVALRKTIYLTIQSSLDFEECAHKLLKMEIKPGQEVELCHMLLDCCAEQRTYEKFFGLLAQRFCQINRIYVEPFEGIFQDSYNTVHRLDTNKLRNVAKFFAHLLFTDAISWNVLSVVKLNEEDTTSSSRIFIKILFQELSEYMGLGPLNARVKDPTLQEAMDGLFPRDNPKNTRFAINFFTSIGLGGLTDELREHLKTQPKPSAVPQLISQLSSSSSSSSSDSSSSSSSSSSSDTESDDDSESSEDDKKKKKKKKLKNSPKRSKKDEKHKKVDKNKTIRRKDKSERQERNGRHDKRGKDDEFPRSYKKDRSTDDGKYERERQKKKSSKHAEESKRKSESEGKRSKK